NAFDLLRDPIRLGWRELWIVRPCLGDAEVVLRRRLDFFRNRRRGGRFWLHWSGNAHGRSRRSHPRTHCLNRHSRGRRQRRCGLALRRTTWPHGHSRRRGRRGRPRLFDASTLLGDTGMIGAHRFFTRLERTLTQIERSGMLAHRRQRIRQAIHRLEDCRVARGQLPLAHDQHATPQSLGLVRLAQRMTNFRETDEYRSDFRMLRPIRALEREQLQQQWLGLPIVAAFEVQPGEVVQIDAKIGLRGFDALRAGAHGALEQRFGLVERAARHIQCGEVVDAREHARMVGPETLLPKLQRAPEQLFGAQVVFLLIFELREIAKARGQLQRVSARALGLGDGRDKRVLGPRQVALGEQTAPRFVILLPRDRRRRSGSHYDLLLIPRDARLAGRVTVQLALLAALAACHNDHPTTPHLAPASSVTFTLPTTHFVVGDSALATARVLDANGVVIDSAPIVWSSLHTDVATVSNYGEIYGKGPGIARIVAKSGAVADTVSITVDTKAAISIDSMAPKALIAGQPATIYGHQFSSIPTATVLRIGVDSLAPTSADSTHLVFVLPDTSCSPAGTRTVTVKSRGSTAAVIGRFAPGSPPVTMPVGGVQSLP